MLTDKDVKQFTVLAGRMDSALQALALERRIVKPHYELIVGPAVGTIPNATKAFNIVNIGLDGDNLVFEDVAVTGITGTASISKHLTIFGYTIENDRNNIKGPVTVTPAAGHHVILQYLL